VTRDHRRADARSPASTGRARPAPAAARTPRPRLARRWHGLGFEQRRRLALASTRGAHDLADADAEVVRALAEARVATGWRLQVAALVFGWLMLMTLWGFGRSTYPEAEQSWLAAGLVAGGLVWLGAAIAGVRRVRRARTVAQRLDTDN
jgi:hypothetical protein